MDEEKLDLILCPECDTMKHPYVAGYCKRCTQKLISEGRRGELKELVRKNYREIQEPARKKYSEIQKPALKKLREELERINKLDLEED